MATLLNSSTFNGKNGTHFKLNLYYDYSQSVENNQTTITYSLYFTSYDGYSGSGSTVTGYVNNSSVGTTTSIGVNANLLLGTKTETITHNNDGTFPSTSYSALIDTPWTLGDASVSGTLSGLPTIARASIWNSSLLSISNIASAFTLPITKYASSFYNVVEVRNNNNTLAVIKTINNAVNGTSVTFTSSELNTIYTMDNNVSAYPLIFYMDLKTYTNSSKTTQVGSTQRLKCEAYLQNGNPTATYTITEQDAGVISFLGSSTSSTIIKNASDLLFSVVVTTKNSATVKSVKVNGASASLSSGTTYTVRINNITTGTFSIVVTDSRNLSQTYTATKTAKNYTPCKINSWSIARETATSSTIKLTASLSCDGTNTLISSNDNTKKVQYRVGSSGTWRNATFTLGTTITITNLSLTDTVAYTSQQTIYLKFSDNITTASDNKILLKGIPTFYYGSTDFGINGDLYVYDTSGSNKIDMTHIYEVGTELLIGYWKNGTTTRKVFRKVLSTGNLPNATSKNVPLGISNLETLLKLTGTATTGTTTIPLPYIGTTIDNSARVYRSGTNVKIATGADLSGYSGYIIVEYTKTTG